MQAGADFLAWTAITMQVSSAAEVMRVMREQLAEQLSRPKYELLIRP